MVRSKNFRCTELKKKFRDTYWEVKDENIKAVSYEPRNYIYFFWNLDYK